MRRFDYFSGNLVRMPDGAWVPYVDVEDLQRQLAEVTRERDTLKAMLDLQNLRAERANMKTSELTGALLDYWVGKAEGLEVEICQEQVKPWVCPDGLYCGLGAYESYAPSTDWVDGGPLIDKYLLELEQNGTWGAYNSGIYAEGETPLQAICRAVVRAAFGDEVGEVDHG